MEFLYSSQLFLDYFSFRLFFKYIAAFLWKLTIKSGHQMISPNLKNPHRGHVPFGRFHLYKDDVVVFLGKPQWFLATWVGLVGGW